MRRLRGDYAAGEGQWKLSAESCAPALHQRANSEAKLTRARGDSRRQVRPEVQLLAPLRNEWVLETARDPSPTCQQLLCPWADLFSADGQLLGGHLARHCEQTTMRHVQADALVFVLGISNVVHGLASPS